MYLNVKEELEPPHSFVIWHVGFVFRPEVAQIQVWIDGRDWIGYFPRNND
jgi:hypothetical protein